MIDVPAGTVTALSSMVSVTSWSVPSTGTTVEVILTGTNLSNPTGAYVSFPAKLTIPDDDKNGQDNAKLRVRIEVPPDAPVGYYTIRLATTRGPIPERRSAQAVRAMPPAPAAASRRVAATPAMVIW